MAPSSSSGVIHSSHDRHTQHPAHDAFRMRACRYCRTSFFICRSCDRGHAYCGDECRASARRRDVRQARARYRRSPEARDDHRERMRDWRRKQRGASARAVMDQPSRIAVGPDMVAPTKEVDDVDDRVLHLRAAQRCIMCARRSVWARWYPSRCWGRTPLSAVLRQ